MSIIRNLPIEEYHRHDAVSKSGLDKIHRSIADYQHAKENPYDPSASMVVGSALHDLVLQPELFHDKFALYEETSRRYGKTYDAWRAANPGVTALSASEMEGVLRMAEKVAAHPIASEVLSDGEPEVSLFWTDADTGVECRCRPDWLRSDNVGVDLKTARGADFRGFQRSVAQYRYHVQAAFYGDGIAEVLEQPLDHFLFVVVESDAPYNVAVYELDAEAIEQGRRAYKEDLLRYRDWKTGVDTWTGYPLEILTMPLPGWAKE